MADAAAFFANKKKKKKAFKFNANKIDASTVTQTVHVDAPALSNAAAPEAFPATANVENNAGADGNDAGEQWDDEALAATMVRKGAVASNATSELLDMKALDLKGNEQDDIQEKLRVEETKAKLAAAREGMEKEAQRIKEEREKKESEAANVAPRFGAAAAGMGIGGGKWVPPHMRAGGMAASRLPGATGNQKLDTQDENLFPDLAAADAIIEQQKQNQPIYKVPKKTPVGGGATWGDRPKLNLERKKNVETPPEPQQPEENKARPEEAKEPVAEPAKEKETELKAAEPAAAPKQPIKPKKKKKKDLATFKSSS